MTSNFDIGSFKLAKGNITKSRIAQIMWPLQDAECLLVNKLGDSRNVLQFTLTQLK